MRRRSTSLTSGRWSSVFWPPDARRAAVPRMAPGRPRALQRPWALDMSSVIAVPDRAMPPFPAGAMLRLRYRLRIGPSEAQDMNSPNRPSINRAHRSPPRAASAAAPRPTTAGVGTHGSRATTRGRLLAALCSGALLALTAGCVVVPARGVPVAYVAPVYPSPGAGWVWVRHPVYGWGWRHPVYGWQRGWES